MNENGYVVSRHTTGLASTIPEPYTLRIEPRAAYLSVDLSGQLDLLAARQVARDVARACAAHGRWCVLVVLTWQTHLSLLDRFELVNHLHEFGFDRQRARMALCVSDPGASAEFRFVETVALNRDWQLRVFTDAVEAAGWLGADRRGE